VCARDGGIDGGRVAEVVGVDDQQLRREYRFLSYAHLTGAADALPDFVVPLTAACI